MNKDRLCLCMLILNIAEKEFRVGFGYIIIFRRIQ